jgi:hypothetical protein
MPRAVPDSDKVMAIGTGHHTLAAGPVVLLDPRVGMNAPAAVERLTGPDKWPEYNKGVTPGPSPAGWHAAPGNGWYMDPWPLSERAYLAAYCDGSMTDESGYALYLMDVYGGKELLYRDAAISSVMPVPLAPRPEPPVLADARDDKETDATLLVGDIEQGLDGVAPGTVKYLRVSEPVPWTYSNERGGLRFEPDAKATGTNWTAIRVLGTVPVEADGSAHLKVPADTALYFQALDGAGREVRRMRSYVSFQKGESRGCVGCHETRAMAPARTVGAGLAFAKAPSPIKAPPWGAVPINFLRDVQPVLDRQCASCHTGLTPAGGIDLSGGLTVEHNRAYETLVPGKSSPWLALSNKHDDAKISLPLAFGSARSRLFDVLARPSHAAVKLDDADRERLYTWIDANAVYHDRGLDKRPADGVQPYNLAADTELWKRVSDVTQHACANCHAGAKLARPEWVDLWQPERSPLLACPKAGEAEVRALRGLVEAAVKETWARPRRDLQALNASRRPQ